MASTDKYILQSVESALSVMDLFLAHDCLTPAEVSHYLNMNRSSAYRLLVTLESSGYLMKDEKGRYQLGVKVLTLGQAAQGRMALVNLVHPHLVSISEQTGESCHLAIMDNPTHVTFVDKSVGTLFLNMNILVGYRQFAHLTATGKAILAHASDEFLNNYIRSVSFEQRTDSSIQNARDLLLVLDQIKRAGYAWDREESELGLGCIAVPVLSASGQPIAAISSSGPITRIEKNEQLHIDLLCEKAELIQKALQ